MHILYTGQTCAAFTTGRVYPIKERDYDGDFVVCDDSGQDHTLSPAYVEENFVVDGCNDDRETVLKTLESGVLLMLQIAKDHDIEMLVSMVRADGVTAQISTHASEGFINSTRKGLKKHIKNKQ